MNTEPVGDFLFDVTWMRDNKTTLNHTLLIAVKIGFRSTFELQVLKFKNVWRPWKCQPPITMWCLLDYLNWCRIWKININWTLGSIQVMFTAHFSFELLNLPLASYHHCSMFKTIEQSITILSWCNCKRTVLCWLKKKGIVQQVLLRAMKLWLKSSGRNSK